MQLEPIDIWHNIHENGMDCRNYKFSLLRHIYIFIYIPGDRSSHRDAKCGADQQGHAYLQALEV